jgi:hypothetical protein
VTLVLSLADPQFTIQLSDRRLTTFPTGGVARVVSNEANKAGALICGDARLAYSFTGLAKAGAFDTRQWLRGAILEAAPPEFQIEYVVERLRQIATRQFRKNQDVARLPPWDRRLSVMLAGYWNTTLGCIPAGWIITNFQQNFDLGAGSPDRPDPWDVDLRHGPDGGLTATPGSPGGCSNRHGSRRYAPSKRCRCCRWKRREASQRGCCTSQRIRRDTLLLRIQRRDRRCASPGHPSRQESR